MGKINSPLRALLFDMDGTVTRPTLHFGKIQEKIGLPPPLLENMLSLEMGDEKDRAFHLLEKFEHEAAQSSELNAGAFALLERLDRDHIPRGLITRNSRRSVEVTLSRHGIQFDSIRTRDDGPVKPDPSAIFEICQELSVRPEEILLVGDYKYDIEAGERAGSKTALLTNGKTPEFLREIAPDFIIETLSELNTLLDQITNR